MPCSIRNHQKSHCPLTQYRCCFHWPQHHCHLLTPFYLGHLHSLSLTFGCSQRCLSSPSDTCPDTDPYSYFARCSPGKPPTGHYIRQPDSRHCTRLHPHSAPWSYPQPKAENSSSIRANTQHSSHSQPLRLFLGTKATDSLPDSYPS